MSCVLPQNEHLRDACGSALRDGACVLDAGDQVGYVRLENGTAIDVRARPTPHASVDAAPGTESVCLPGRDFTLTTLLGTLDALRRRLARTTRGHEGAFAGFDVLDISEWRDCGAEASIRFTARLVSNETSSQTVEYDAIACAHASGDCQPEEAAKPYIRARGRTVALDRSRQGVAPAQSWGTTIPPHR